MRPPECIAVCLMAIPTEDGEPSGLVLDYGSQAACEEAARAANQLLEKGTGVVVVFGPIGLVWSDCGTLPELQTLLDKQRETHQGSSDGLNARLASLGAQIATLNEKRATEERLAGETSAGLASKISDLEAEAAKVAESLAEQERKDLQKRIEENKAPDLKENPSAKEVSAEEAKSAKERAELKASLAAERAQNEEAKAESDPLAEQLAEENGDSTAESSSEEAEAETPPPAEAASKRRGRGKGKK